MAAQQKCYVTYTSPEMSPGVFTITLLETPFLLASSGTTGFCTWEAALHLATYLCSESGKRFVRGKSVIELGAGTGLVSILCAKYLDAKRVAATDGSAEIINHLEFNMSLNGLKSSSRIETAVLKWGQSLDGMFLDDFDETRSYDLIVAADVTYDPDSIKPLVATLSGLLALKPDSRALISATRRNAETLDMFRKTCNTWGLEIVDLETSHQHLANDSGIFPPGQIQTGYFHSTTVPIETMWIMKTMTS
jgi:protein-lysine N-methyltransferase EEF2KMT